MKRSKTRHVCLLLPLGAALPSIVHAQAAAAPASDKYKIETVIVTVQRHTSTAQKTPASLTVMTADTLKKVNATEIADVVRAVPGVSLTQNAKGGQIFIRGIGGGLDSQIGSPGIALNLDGRYQDQAGPVFGSLFDVNRIEVLRGPQGTLYGRNATAGSINIVTNDPTDHFEGAGSAGIGNYNAQRFEGMLNVPVNDRLDLRLAVVSDKHNGYQTNGLSSADTVAGRVKALVKFSDSVTWLVTGEAVNMNGVPGTVEAPVNARSNPWQAFETSLGLFGQTAFEHTQSRSLASQLNISTSFTDITWLANYQTFKENEDFSFGGQIGVMSPTDDTGSTELRFASPKDSRVVWVTGLYGYRSLKTDLVYTPGSGTTTDYPTIDQHSEALFAQATTPLIDTLSLTLGARYTADQQYNRGRIYFGLPNPSNTTSYFSGKGDWHHFDFKAGLEYQITDHSLLYTNYSTGYKAGGMFQGAPPNTYQPETLKAFVVGSKNRFLDGRLQINAEAFHYQYDNYQVQSVGLIQPAGFGLLIFNAANATLYGGELEAAYKLTPNDQLDVSVAYGEGHFGNNFVVNSPFFGASNYSNEAVPHLPKLSERVGYDHDFNMSNGSDITFHADMEISDGYWVEYTHVPGSYQKAYHRTGAFIQYSTPNSAWSLRTYVRNLENKAVIESAYLFPGSPSTVQLAPPRTFGVTLSAKF